MELSPEVTQLLTGKEIKKNNISFNEDGTLVINDEDNKENSVTLTQEHMKGKADFSDLDKVRDSEYTMLQMKIDRSNKMYKILLAGIGILIVLSMFIIANMH